MPRPDLSPSDEELAPLLVRLGSIFEPQTHDPTFLVLKAHLLCEELLRDFIAKQSKHPTALNEARLTFRQLLKLGQAFAATLEPNDWRWRALTELNRLRNSLAHEFEADSAEVIIQRFISIVIPEVGGDFPKLEEFPRDPQSGSYHPKALALAIMGLYAVLCVRLGADVNLQLAIEGQRMSQLRKVATGANAA